MCELVDYPIVVPAQWYEHKYKGVTYKEGHEEHETNRQIGTVEILYHHLFADAFRGFEKQTLIDVDKCLVPLIEQLHQLDRPTQASCCGHYDWINNPEDEDSEYPWITIFTRPNIEEIEETLKLIQDMHPDWPVYPAIRVGDCRWWIKDHEELDQCRWGIGYSFRTVKCEKYGFGGIPKSPEDFIHCLLTQKHFFD